ncbi:hypothetical protein GQ53DRAFT_834153 [Thozetella sp. PMI_491]|nr:hypothetical protein GQ53DRAFT_834153 [Thozetella sp. PMI_491]
MDIHLLLLPELPECQSDRATVGETSSLMDFYEQNAGQGPDDPDEPACSFQPGWNATERGMDEDGRAGFPSEIEDRDLDNDTRSMGSWSQEAHATLDLHEYPRSIPEELAEPLKKDKQTFHGAFPESNEEAEDSASTKLAKRAKRSHGDDNSSIGRNINQRQRGRGSRSSTINQVNPASAPQNNTSPGRLGSANTEARGLGRGPTGDSGLDSLDASSTPPAAPKS